MRAFASRLVDRLFKRNTTVPPSARKARLELQTLEGREAPGNLAGGLVSAAFGGSLTDPLEAMSIAVGDFGLLRNVEPQPIRAVRSEQSAATVRFHLPSDQEMMLELMRNLDRSREAERPARLPEAPIGSMFASGAMLEVDEFGSPESMPFSLNSLDLGGGFASPVPSGTAGDDPGTPLTRPSTSEAGGLIDLSQPELPYSLSSPSQAAASGGSSEEIGEGFTSSLLAEPIALMAVGTDAGVTGQVKIYDAATQNLLYDLNPFGSGFTGGVRVAVGDVNGDGQDDVVVGQGTSGSTVKVIDGTDGTVFTSGVAAFDAFGSGVNGVFVAAGDVNGDGNADVIVGSDTGSAPQVKIFSGEDGSLIRSFVPEKADFTGGIRVAAGDVNADGKADVITANGIGGKPRVKVFDGGNGAEIYSILPFESEYRGGIHLSAGDLNGDGAADLIVAKGAGQSAVRVFSGADTSVLPGVSEAYESFTGGVRVGVADTDGDGTLEILSQQGSGGGTLKGFEAPDENPTLSESPFGSSFAHGAFVAGSSWTSGGTFGALLGTPVANIYRVSDGIEGSSDAMMRFRITLSEPGSLVSVIVPITGASSTAGNGDLAGEDLTLVVMFDEFETEKIIEIPSGTDTGREGDETFVATITSGDGYTVGADNKAVAVVRDLNATNFLAPGSSSGLAAALGLASDGPVTGEGGLRLADGLAAWKSTDLLSEGYGSSWGLFRTYSGTQSLQTPGWFGNNVHVSTLPYLYRDANNSNVLAALSGTDTRMFDHASGSFTARYYQGETLSLNATTHEFTLTDTLGNKIVFNDFDSSIAAAKRGQFKSFADAKGNAISVNSYSSDKPEDVRRSVTVGGDTIEESMLFTYLTSGTNSGKVSNAVLRRRVNAGSWSTVRQVDYSYYGTSDANGTPGDLKKAVVKDGAGNPIDTEYYRYYTAFSSTGFAGGLKYAFTGESYERLVNAYPTPESATDSQVDDFADVYYEYDSIRRVTKQVLKGELGQGEYNVTYTPSAFADGYNNWRMKTVETLPDGNQSVVYSNFAGQPVLEVFKEGATEWKTFYQYDAEGRLTLKANPSAVTGYDEARADLVYNNAGNYTYVSDSAGLIETTSYYTSTTATSSTAGGADGYVYQTHLKRGETGTGVLQSTQDYYSRAGSGTTIFPVANSTQYRNDNGTGGQTTSTSYTWYSGTTQMESMTVTMPTVTTAQNGPNSAASETTYFDGYGRPIWHKDADGFLSYTEYDQATGAVTKQISDVNTATTADFANLPSGWSTPGGGGLHLKTLYEVDHLGRTTKETYPNGRVDYTVYDDDNHEVRTYSGWDSTTNLPTGPTMVWREDRARGYTESLTMSATPSVSSGRPTGAESISGVQTISRSYVNAAGQVTHVDEYFNLSGVTYSTSASLGTEGTNFYRTEYAYDNRGRLVRTEKPTGTISRTVYDGLSRTVSAWIGTDDTPSSGSWSPTNLTGTNTVKVAEYEYDSGGVGDSLLTKTTAIPGGSEANRVTQNFYDWRDRLVATKNGVEVSESTSLNRFITYATYDNLNQVTATEVFDGDNVTVTSTSGVPDKPSSSLLRAKSTQDYDEWGRVFKSSTYSVDPSTGSVSSNALVSQNWFDKRGNLIKSSSPGGLVGKAEYDGVGRVTKQYSTDGGGDSGYSDSDDVASDNVLSQVELTYDGNGNVLFTISKERFHDETGTGALGTPSTGVKARVSYQAAYYDKGDRFTDSVDVGTNGGSTYTRLSSVPSRSDTVLVNSQTYNSAGWVFEATDPHGLVNRSEYDNLGRVTKQIENYVDGTPSDADDKTVEYTYDGSGHMLTLKAKLTGGAYQTTEWVYGVTGTIASNDMLKETKYPDASTGNSSSSEKDQYTYNALGQTLTKTDRNGNVHTYAYDILGRVVSDTVSTLGSGVDGGVRRIETAYDTQGNAYLLTSYDATTSGNIVNQVKREFNGLGQLTKEWESHSGAVTGSSPKVQYTYSEMASGANHSRLTSMVYADGYTLNYNYASGLSSDISRLSSISDSGNTLESYEYLGLGTVVKRGHSQSGVDLTMIKQVGESDGDAGDKYIGLDRFGRVVDQRWRSSSADVDRYQYGYDRDGNRLWRDNLVNAAFGELYAYDGLNQLTSMDRGTLNGTKTGLTGAASRAQDWDYDALGNWDSVTTNGIAQTRTHNAQNEIAGISGATTPTYDANGNLTTDETGRTFKYDAWNRLVEVKTSGGSTIVTYKYDALTRRVSETKGANTRDFYYSSGWQVLEERLNGTTDTRYVWSPVYVDAMILRDRDTDVNGSLDERLYALHDANYNVTALVNTSGTVVERYAYDAYGVATVYDGSWNVRTGGSSYGWLYMHQGGRWEGATGLYQLRNREYSPALGRWFQMDPIGFSAGDGNMYRAFLDNPLLYTDALGLQSKKEKKIESGWRIVPQDYKGEYPPSPYVPPATLGEPFPKPIEIAPGTLFPKPYPGPGGLLPPWLTPAPVGDIWLPAPTIIGMDNPVVGLPVDPGVIAPPWPVVERPVSTKPNTASPEKQGYPLIVLPPIFLEPPPTYPWRVLDPKYRDYYQKLADEEAAARY